MNQPSPPRRVSSRVRTLDGYDAQGAVAEVVLDENCNFNVSGDDDDDVLSTGVVATSSSTSPAKKQGSVYVGMKRFQSSPAALSSRVSSFFNPGIATNRTDSSNESCDSPSPSASEQSPSHSEPQRSPTCTPTSNADDNAVDDDGDFQEGECSEAEVRRNKESEKSSKCKSIFICATLLAVASGVGIAVSHSIHPFLPFAMSSNEPEPIEQLQQPEAMLPNDTSYTFDDGTTNREQPQPQQSDTVNEEQPPIPTAILIPTSSNETKITFYAMADAPYTDHERTVIMPQQIANLQNNSYTNFTNTDADDAAFLVHLGDLQRAKVDECREHAYQNASAILKKSSLPVFVIPGDNDINDCEELEHGEAMWRQYFDKFDERWNHTFEAKRWGKIGQESFAFLHNRILFIGLNIVGGSPHSYTEWRARHAVHLNNTKAIMTAHKDDFSVVVFFGHATPTEYHQDFFDGEDGFVKFVEKLGKPLLHLHGDDHEWAEYEAAWGLSNYLMVSLDAGEIAPPIKVEIDTSKENPIKIDRMEQDLEVECCKDGWPRLVDDVQNT